MSIDMSIGKQKANQDITWNELIEHSEAEIKAHGEKIRLLRKSIVFFKQQAMLGVPFPKPKLSRHSKIS